MIKQPPKAPVVGKRWRKWKTEKYGITEKVKGKEEVKGQF